MSEEQDKPKQPKRRGYTTIDTKEWAYLQDKAKLSSNALLVLMELLCGRDRNMIGFYQIELTWPTLSKRLGIEYPDLEQAFKELKKKDFIAYDPDSEVVLVKENFRHMPLQNMDMAVKAGYVLESVPYNSLFPEFASMLEGIIQHHRKIEAVSKKPYSEEIPNPGGKTKRPAGKPSDWYKHLSQQLYEYGLLQENHAHNKHGVKHGVKHGGKHKDMDMDMDLDLDLDLEKDIKSLSQFTPEKSNPKVTFQKNRFNLEMAFQNKELLDQYKDFWERGLVATQEEFQEFKRLCQRFLETTSVVLSSERWLEEAVKMFDAVMDSLERGMEIGSLEELEKVIDNFMEDPPNGSKDKSICLFNQHQVKAICMSRLNMF